MWNKLPSSPGGETCACNSSFVVAVLCVAVCRVKTSTLLALTDPCSSNYNEEYDEDAFQGNDDALKYPVAWPIYFLFAKLRQVGGTMHFTLSFLHCFFPVCTLHIILTLLLCYSIFCCLYSIILCSCCSSLLYCLVGFCSKHAFCPRGCWLGIGKSNSFVSLSLSLKIVFFKGHHLHAREQPIWQ